MRAMAAFAAAAALAGGLTACGEDAEPAGDAAGTAAESKQPAAVAIRTFMYEPSPLEVERGTTVTFTNEDDILHTVTEGRRGDPVADGFDEQLDGAGTAAEITFDEPGTIDYICTVHAGMDGEVVVR